MQFYSSEELAAIEAGADSIHSKAEAKLLPAECFHVTAGKAGLPKRTKFFFGARYLWTREQMSTIAAARRAHGVRVDVPAPPAWMQVADYISVHMSEVCAYVLCYVPCCPVLCCAVLCCAVLCCAVLCCAQLCNRTEVVTPIQGDFSSSPIIPIIACRHKLRNPWWQQAWPPRAFSILMP